MTRATKLTPRAQRVDAHWYVRVGHPVFGVIAAQLVNVSISGLLFRAPVHFDIEDRLTVEIWLDGKLRATVAAEVVRTEAVTSKLWQYAARYESNDTWDMRRIRERLPHELQGEELMD